MMMLSLLSEIRKSQGFTLIESLVALLVLSIGLLGVAAMQVKALQSSHMSYLRSVASLVALDAQERAWAFYRVENRTRSPDLDRKCPDPAGSGVGFFNELESDWQNVGAGRFSVLVPDDGDLERISGRCAYDLSISWSDSRFLSESDTFLIYRFYLVGND